MELGSNGIQNKGSGGAGPTNIDVNFNSNLEGQANATNPLNVNLTDGVNPVTPTSVLLTGNDLDIVIPAPVVPSGVLFKTIQPGQYTSYQTGDEGWRAQNNWYDYTPPSNPKAVAELDYTSANYFWLLKDNLIVNGVSSKNRFVDVNGLQVFSATNNANLVVIDKLTGLMFTKTLLTAAVWGTAISNALAYSIIVNSITYDDWFITSLNECLNIYNIDQSISINVDSATGVTIFPVPTSIWVSTSQTSTSKYNFQNNFRTITSQNAPAVLSTIAVRNARNLITAP
jgi:hypothetical protein